jgi:Ribbon-helix-helix domain
MKPMKRTTIMLPEPQIKALQAASKRTGIKIAELIRRFIDEGLKRIGP